MGSVSIRGRGLQSNYPTSWWKCKRFHLIFLVFFFLLFSNFSNFWSFFVVFSIPAKKPCKSSQFPPTSTINPLIRGIKEQNTVFVAGSNWFVVDIRTFFDPVLFYFLASGGFFFFRSVVLVELDLYLCLC